MVVWVACIADPSGKLMTLLDSPVMGRFSSGQTKLELCLNLQPWLMPSTGKLCV
jgi:hypothetical protein